LPSEALLIAISPGYQPATAIYKRRVGDFLGLYVASDKDVFLVPLVSTAQLPMRIGGSDIWVSNPKTPFEPKPNLFFFLAFDLFLPSHRTLGGNHKASRLNLNGVNHTTERQDDGRSQMRTSEADLLRDSGCKSGNGSRIASFAFVFALTSAFPTQIAECARPRGIRQWKCITPLSI
jgi:hypothetical protein